MSGVRSSRVAVLSLLVLVMHVLPVGARGLGIPIPVPDLLVLSGTLTVDTIRTYRAPSQGLMSSVTREHLAIRTVLGHTWVIEDWQTSERMVPYWQNDCAINGFNSAAMSGIIINPAAVWFLTGGWPSPMDVFRGATQGLQPLIADGVSAASLVGLDGSCQHMANELRLTVPYGGLAAADDFLGNGIPVGSHVVTVGSDNERVRSTWSWAFDWMFASCLALQQVISPGQCFIN